MSGRRGRAQTVPAVLAGAAMSVALWGSAWAAEPTTTTAPPLTAAVSPARPTVGQRVTLLAQPTPEATDQGVCIFEVTSAGAVRYEQGRVDPAAAACATTFAFTAAGPYRVVSRLRSGQGRLLTSTAAVGEVLVPAVHLMITPSTARVGELLEVKAAFDYHGAGRPTYEYAFGDGTPPQEGGPEVRYRFGRPGRFAVQVTVAVDGAAVAAPPVMVEVRAAQPAPGDAGASGPGAAAGAVTRPPTAAGPPSPAAGPEQAKGTAAATGPDPGDRRAPPAGLLWWLLGAFAAIVLAIWGVDRAGRGSA